MIHIMFFRLTEQQGARFCRIVVTSVWFINPIPYVSADICFGVMSDPEITIPYLGSIWQADIEIICRDPLPFRRCIARFAEFKKQFLRSEI